MQDHQKIEQALEYIKNGHYRYDPDFPPLPDPPVLGESGHVIAHDRILDSLLYLKANPVMGMIVQVVRATDSTERATTSTSLVDANLSLTITPHVETSNVLLFLNYPRVLCTSSTVDKLSGSIVITDASDNLISGNAVFGTQRLSYSQDGVVNNVVTLIAQATPATLSAMTYKTQFASFDPGNIVTLQNQFGAGQLYAIEVRA